jgi:hypothetical protein
MIDTINLSEDFEYIYIKFPPGINFLTRREEYRTWCLEHDGFGTCAFGGHGVYLTDERDASMFLLRWGS